MSHSLNSARFTPTLGVKSFADKSGDQVLKFHRAEQEIGELYMTSAPEIAQGAVEVSWSQVSEGLRGQGLGKEVYRHAIETARAQGKTYFVSDAWVSEDAQRVWASLAKEYPVRKTVKMGGRMMIDLRTSKSVMEAGRTRSGIGMVRNALARLAKYL